MSTEFNKRPQLLSRRGLAFGVAVLALGGLAVFGLGHLGKAPHGNSEVSSQARKGQPVRVLLATGRLEATIDEAIP